MGAKGITLFMFLTAVAGVVVAACGATTTVTRPLTPITSAIPVQKLQAVTTTAILADFVRNVGGEMVEVRSIVPSGADVHSFQPTPKDSISISRARIIVSNGLGIDDYLQPVLESARGPEVVHVAAGEGLAPMVKGQTRLDPIDLIDGTPHPWQNPLHAVHYVERIRDGLIKADPAMAQVYRSNADAYILKLRDLDQEIGQTLSAVPPDRRHLVSYHDAFGYFAQRYGWKVSAFVPGDASDVTPSAVVAVLKLIEEEGIPVVFAEPQFNSDLINLAAADSGIRIAVIYSGVLDADVPTYIDMMRFNAKSLLTLGNTR